MRLLVIAISLIFMFGLGVHALRNSRRIQTLVQLNRRRQFWRFGASKKEKDDFIDVDTGISYNNVDKKQQKTEGGGIFNSLAKLFGQDERSIEKKRQRKEMNTAIDKVLSNSGVTGKLIGGIVKGVAGMIADAAENVQSDMKNMNQLVISSLENDDESRRLIGDPIRVDQVFSSSSSTMIVNGVQQKQVSIGMMVSGNRDSAVVQVEAMSGSGNEGLIISQLTAQLQSNGKLIRVMSSGSGGKPGPYNQPGRGKVIDVTGTEL